MVTAAAPRPSSTTEVIAEEFLRDLRRLVECYRAMPFAPAMPTVHVEIRGEGVDVRAWGGCGDAGVVDVVEEPGLIVTVMEGE